MATLRPVVVTTQWRGVFFGYTDAPHYATELVLEKMRNCLTWDASVGGVFGLAEVGPIGTSSRLGRLRTLPTGVVGVTSISDCTPEAEKAWLR